LNVFKRFITVCSLLCIPLVFIRFGGTDIDWDLVRKIQEELEDNYYEEVEEDVLLKNAVKGMLTELDPYTDFYSPEEVSILDGVIKGEYGGIGLTIDKKSGKIVVISPAENSPAIRAGIQPGDVIIRINGKSVENMKISEIAPLTRGKTGREVTVTVQRGGKNGMYIDFTMETEIVKIKDVPFYSMIEDGIGYIRLSHFSRLAPDEVQKALSDLTRVPVRGIILDLRGNPGGLLSSAVKISNYFLPRGKMVVYTEGRKREYNVKFYSTKKPLYENSPLVVLVDKGSASAAEIVSGAIQDNDRGIIVGTRTFGKGLVQSIFRPEKDIAIKITTSRYFTPVGRLIHRYTEDEENNEKFTKADTFYTANKRVVLGGGGITPDVICVEDSVIQNVLSAMRSESLFIRYASLRFSQKDFAIEQIPEEDVLLHDFRKFLEQEDYKIPLDGIQELEEIKSTVSGVKYLALVDSLESHIYRKNRVTMDLIGKKLSRILRSTIIRMHLGEERAYEYTVEDDPVVVRAMEIIKDNEKYYSFLGR